MDLDTDLYADSAAKPNLKSANTVPLEHVIRQALDCQAEGDSHHPPHRVCILGRTSSEAAVQDYRLIPKHRVLGLLRFLGSCGSIICGVDSK